MGMKKKPALLRTVLLEYLFSIFFVLFLSVLIPSVLLMIGVYEGWYSYANSSETAAQDAKPRIESAEKFDPSLVPVSCKYVFINNDFKTIQGNMDKANAQNAVNYAKGKYIPASLNEQYLVVKRKDGSCILYYSIRSHYNIDWMNRYLPDLEKSMLLIIALNCLFSCLGVTAVFSRRLKKQLKPLLNATKKIGGRDLDFDISPSGIKEFSDISDSISDMKSELKHSLKQQWRMEQMRKEQIAALAHDIKTPLTIISGNAELLCDTPVTKEQEEYLGYILKNSGRMEKHLEMLISLTRTEAGYTANMKTIETKGFIERISDQAKGLAASKHIEITFITKSPPLCFTADAVLLERAVMNIVSNAVDYTPEYGTIKMYICEGKKSIRFSVEDSGKGFSEKDLEFAVSQFYMGSKSRGTNAHFGIGLYICDNIAKLHHGSLIIANSLSTGGGIVTIEIPAV